MGQHISFLREIAKSSRLSLRALFLFAAIIILQRMNRHRQLFHLPASIKSLLTSAFTIPKLQTIHSGLQIVAISSGVLLTVMSIMWLREKAAEEREAKAVTTSKKEKWLALSGRTSLPTLTPHEENILADVIFPDQLSHSFADVGGLKSIKRTLYESVLVPLQQPELFRTVNEKHTLLGVPSGILFYGPPGTGKTLMAKSIAKSAGCTFINVSASSLQNKWFGESQKLVRALFSLAEKLAPSIIFIDECDAFMRKRGSSVGHEASSTMASEFLTLADGLLTSNRSDPTRTVTLLACTNRPFDIDEAFLRRLPRTFFFDLPSRQERIAILKVLLQGHALDPTVDFQRLAEWTNKCSGSDLKEICKIAASRPLRKLIQKHSKADYERVMSGKERPKKQLQKNNDLALHDENDAVTKELLAAITAATQITSSSTASSAATSSSPSTSASSSSTTLSLSSARPLLMSDFRSAIRDIRPAGLDESAMTKLKQWQSAHGHSSSSRQSLDEEEDGEDRLSDASDSEADQERNDKRHASKAAEAKDEDEEDEIYR